MNETDELKSIMKRTITFPSTMINVEESISGLAFFPGGRGLYNDFDTSIKNKPIMIIGHDFGKYEDFKKSVINGHENLSGATWRNLLCFFEEIKKLDVRLEDCFFTNVIMGFRDSKSSVKNPEYKKNKDFVNECVSFLKKQIEFQKPQLIIVLGKETFKYWAEISDDLKFLNSIGNYKNLDSIYANSNFISKNTSLKNSNLSFKIVFITHPCQRKLNLKYRKFENLLIGADAEIAMLKIALDK